MKACLVCGVEFKPHRKSQRYCSVQCMGKARIGNTWGFAKGYTPWNRGKEGVNRAERNGNWKGEEIKYHARHRFVRVRKDGTACESCGREPEPGATAFHLANKTHVYTRNPDDYMRLCAKCHRDYDVANGLRPSHGFHGRMLEFQGVTRNIAGWAREIGMSPITLQSRLKRWPLEKALTAPVRKKRCG